MRIPRPPRAIALALLAAWPGVGPGYGQGDAAGAASGPGLAVRAAPADLCRAAAAGAARRHGVPVDMLRAIALVESRRRTAAGSGPWPWTLNVAGRGAWFESRGAALAAAEAAVAGGQRSVDLGCFQINFRWHGEHFRGLGHMLEPGAGADYAARYLAELRAESGDWLTAAGWYHSRTPEHFRRYRGLIARALKELDADIAALDGAPPAIASPAIPGPASTAKPPAAAPAARDPESASRTPAPGPGATPGGVRLTLVTRVTRRLVALPGR